MGIARALIAQRCRNGEPITVAFLTTIWPAVVGSDMARRTRPIRLAESKLVVEVSSQLWQRELDRQRQRMLDQVNHFLPRQLDTLTFVVSTASRFPNSTPPAPRPPAPEGVVPDHEAAILEEMPDLELRALMLRLRRLHKGRQQDG